MGADALLSVRGLAGGVVHDVDLELARGRTLGLVGPSGSGKSTLARMIALVERPASGGIRIGGRNLWTLDRRERRRARAEVQLIFQEPASSLNPRFTAEEIVGEPLRISGADTGMSVSAALEAVGLPANCLRRRALDFSGGERQRLAIARALTLQPKLLILDESLSGLDLSVEAQIANLLLDLQQQHGLTYILIAHDLALVAQIADEIAVMDAGAVVEHASTAELLAAPRHPRTRELLEAGRALSLEGLAR